MIHGDYLLRTVDGDRVPTDAVHSGIISLRSGETYTAYTCYAFEDWSSTCLLERTESGRYSMHGAMVTLHDDFGYSRTLRLAGNALVQVSSGDTGAKHLMYARW